MIEEQIVTPPARTPLMEEGGHEPKAKTATRDWWLYWNRLTLKGNQNATDIDKLEQDVGQLVIAAGALDAEVALLLRQGAHAERLAAAPEPKDSLWVETDRSNVIYQVQESGILTWAYVTGTMWGTLSPDERPTDLGALDAGFEFRTEDQPGRHFIWSGAAWVEVTPVRYGTHAERLAAPPAAFLHGILFAETDRGNVLYQTQGGGWVYVAGEMFAAFGSRPADLGANDTGFRFVAGDTRQSFRWSGSAWLDETPGGDAQIARLGSNWTVTTTPLDVPDCSLILSRAGLYLIQAVFNIMVTSGDFPVGFRGALSAGGVSQPGGVYFVGTANFHSAMQFQQWLYTAASPGAIAKLQFWKEAGTGTSALAGGNTTIMAQWVRP